MSEIAHRRQPPRQVPSGDERMQAVYKDFRNLSPQMRDAFWTDDMFAGLIRWALVQRDVQRMTEAGFLIMQPATSDTGGLLLTAITGTVKIQKFAKIQSKCSDSRM